MKNSPRPGTWTSRPGGSSTGGSGANSSLRRSATARPREQRHLHVDERVLELGQSLGAALAHVDRDELVQRADGRGPDRVGDRGQLGELAPGLRVEVGDQLREAL